MPPHYSTAPLRQSQRAMRLTPCIPKQFVFVHSVEGNVVGITITVL